MVEPMKIEPTQYTREDGVAIIKHRNNKWLLRSTLGATWFWDPEDQEWVISHLIRTPKDLDAYTMPFEQAMSLLTTVEKKR